MTGSFIPDFADLVLEGESLNSDFDLAPTSIPSLDGGFLITFGNFDLYIFS